MTIRNMTVRRITKALEGVDLDGVDITNNNVEIQIMDGEHVDYEATQAKGDEIHKILGENWQYRFNGYIAFLDFDPHGESRHARNMAMLDQLGPAYYCDEDREEAESAATAKIEGETVNGCTIYRLPNAFMDTMIARNKRIAELRASGLTCENVANRLGIKQSIVENLSGADLPNVPRPPAPERTLDVKELAGLIRKALKQSFPGVKFSVRSDRYSMGSSVNVSWTDGPTNKQVNDVLDAYRDVDGTRCDDSEIMRCNALDGVPVRFGSYVSTSRDHSDAFIAGVKASIEQLTDIERAKFFRGMNDHQREYPYVYVSLAQQYPSSELERITRLDHLQEKTG